MAEILLSKGQKILIDDEDLERLSKGIIRIGGRNKGRWAAGVTIGGRQIHLGSYDTEFEAAAAYDAGARKYFGEFAALNFPEPGEQSALR